MTILKGGRGPGWKGCQRGNNSWSMQVLLGRELSPLCHILSLEVMECRN